MMYKCLQASCCHSSSFDLWPHVTWSPSLPHFLPLSNVNNRSSLSDSCRLIRLCNVQLNTKLSSSVFLTLSLWNGRLMMKKWGKYKRPECVQFPTFRLISKQIKKDIFHQQKFIKKRVCSGQKICPITWFCSICAHQWFVYPTAPSSSSSSDKLWLSRKHNCDSFCSEFINPAACGSTSNRAKLRKSEQAVNKNKANPDT